MTASLTPRPLSSRRRLISATTSTPLITATPKSEMKPTAANTERDNAADERERHAHQHQPRMARFAEGREEQPEDQRDRDRQDQVKPPSRALQVLEHASPRHLVALVKFNRSFEALLRFRYKTSLIAPADVGANGNLPLVLAPRDDRGAVGHCDFRQLRERHAPAVTRGNQDAPDGVGVGPGFGGVAQGEGELPFAFKDAAHSPPADGQLDHVLHVADVDAVARHLVAFDADAELSLFVLLLD